MSVGFFLGVKPSYLAEAAPLADAFVREINVALAKERLPPYSEPPAFPSPYVGHKFGRSSLDHCSAGDLEALADFCPPGAECPNLDVLAMNPYRFALLPLDFSKPLRTGYSEDIGGERTDIWIGSLPALAAELTVIAPQLGIPLSNGMLSDETAETIDDYQPLGSEETAEPNDRIAWLLMYEGCRLAMACQAALSLAG